MRLPVIRGVLRTMALLLRENKRRAALGVLLILAGALSSPLIGVGLARLTDAAVAGQPGGAAVAGALVGVLAVIQLTAGHFAHITIATVGERADITVDSELIAMVQGTPGIESHERSDYADNLALLRNEIGGLVYIVQGVLQTVAVLAQLVLTIMLLGGLQPLLLSLPVIAVVPYLAGRYAQRLHDRSLLKAAEPQRRARALVNLAARPGAAQEIRLAGTSDELRRRQRALLAETATTLIRAEQSGTWVRTGSQIVFAAAYATALLIVVRNVVNGRGTVGDVMLVLVLARQVNSGVAQLLGLASSVQQAARIGTRWDWLRTTAQGSWRVSADRPAPKAIRQHIRLEGVRFRYPGTDVDVLADLNLTLRAGTVAALVGVNGAGKSTLVKLLCRLYEPTSGRIHVDGEELATISPHSWQRRISAAFQDFGRLEFTAAQTVGIGDLTRIDDAPAVVGALRRAGAESLLDKLPDGLDTEIGASFVSGRELSGGEWQKLALGRAMMRPAPLLLVLDEPSASMDASAEHELFERHAAQARHAARTNGAITLLVSHRFSTVTMADLIIVLNDGRIAEQGTHRELLAKGGAYAELFELQARNYR